MNEGKMSIISRFKNKEESYSLENKPVISIPDTWIDPIIGLCTEQSKDGVFTIRDFVSNNEVKVKYKTYFFTTQRLQFVLKSNRFDLCSVLYPENALEEIYQKEKTIYLLKIPEITNRLRNNGFWDILIQYNSQNKIPA